jgi:hypothetical protein
MLRPTIGRRTGWVLGLALAFSGGCADQGLEQLAKRPASGAAEGAGAAQRKVVLFRVALDAGGKSMDAPWSLHLTGLRLFAVVGPADAGLSARNSFEPGWPDAVSSDNGWAFVALPPGAYQLAIEGTAMRFTMAGSQYVASDALMPIARSPPVRFIVPPDPGLFYIGTFNFTCERVMSNAESLRLECRNLEISNEAELARQVAQKSFGEYGAMRELSAVPAEN